MRTGRFAMRWSLICRRPHKLGSKLSKWFMTRTQSPGKRVRRIAIVVMARGAGNRFVAVFEGRLPGLRADLYQLPSHTAISTPTPVHRGGLDFESTIEGIPVIHGGEDVKKITIATALLGERRYVTPMASLLESCKETARRAFADGEERDRKFDADVFRLFARLVADHDAQLKFAPLRMSDLVANIMKQHH